MASIKELFTAILDELRNKRFYGSLEVHIQNGLIVRVKKHETILVADPQPSKEH